jgi:hypothetical protein
MKYLLLIIILLNSCERPLPPPRLYSIGDLVLLNTGEKVSITYVWDIWEKTQYTIRYPSIQGKQIEKIIVHETEIKSKIE